MNASRHIVLLLLICLGCGNFLSAQNRYDFSQLGDETGKFYTQPLHWEGGDWVKLGLLGAGTFLTMQVDQPVRDAVLRDQRFYQSVPVEAGRIWGDPYMTPIVAAALGLHGWLTDNSSTKKTAFELGQALIYSVTITQLLSKSVGRARPNQDQGNASYQPFTLFGEDYHSLPGGHSSAAFILSTVLSRNVSSGFLKILAFIPPLFTLVSRVYQDYHWASDDLLGASIGYVVADWVVSRHEQNEHRVRPPPIYPLTLRIILN